MLLCPRCALELTSISAMDRCNQIYLAGEVAPKLLFDQDKKYGKVAMKRQHSYINTNRYVPKVFLPSVHWLSKFVLQPEQRIAHGFPFYDFMEGGIFIQESDTILYLKNREAVNQNPDGTKFDAICQRCGKACCDNDRKVFKAGVCVYHPGKLNGFYWECCRKVNVAPGCKNFFFHMTKGLVPGKNGPFRFSDTKHFQGLNARDIVALHTEVCYTLEGIEISKLTVVDENQNVIVQRFIKPRVHVVDYLTDKTGVREEDLRDAPNLRDVKIELKDIISSRTIIVGYRLNESLRVLQMKHDRVIDIAILFSDDTVNYPKKTIEELCCEMLGERIYKGDKMSTCEVAKASMRIALIVGQEDKCARLTIGQFA